MVIDKVLQHPDSLVEGAHSVVLRDTILLQEVILASQLCYIQTAEKRSGTDLEHLCDLEGDLVRLSQCTLSDQLYDLGQILLLLQNLLCSGTQVDETGVDFFVMGVEHLEVLRVRDAENQYTGNLLRAAKLTHFQSTEGKSEISATGLFPDTRLVTYVFAERDAWTNPSYKASAITVNTSHISSRLTRPARYQEWQS